MTPPPPTNEDTTTGAPASRESWVVRLIELVGDRLNPILVKETRQAVKSRQFTLWFVLLLVACWITTIAAIAIIGPSIYYVSAGPYLLYAYYMILCLPLVVVAPFSAYRSLSSENEENTRDLLEVSSLTTRQMINGKLGSAALQVVVYLSALAPCIAFTYLLRGVSLATIAMLLVYAVFASMGLSALGLLVAAATRKKSAQTVASVGLAAGLFGAYAALVQTPALLMELDARRIFQSDEFFNFNIGLLTFYATTLAIVYTATLGLMTFTSANRSTPVRWALFAQTIAFVGVMGAGIATSSRPIPREFLIRSYMVAVVYWFVAGAVMSGERPTLSLRVRRSLPQSLLGRATSAWFHPGGASGYMFTTVNLLGLAVLTTAVGYLAATGSPSDQDVAYGVFLMWAYTAVYLGVGRLVVIGLRRVTELSLLATFLIQALVALACSGLPYVVDTLTDRIRVADAVWINAFSGPWNVSQLLDGRLSVERQITLGVTVGAVAVSLWLVNAVMAGHEARRLRVAKPKRVIEDDLEMAPKPELEPTNPWGDLPEVAGDGLNPTGGA